MPFAAWGGRSGIRRSPMLGRLRAHYSHRALAALQRNWARGIRHRERRLARSRCGARTVRAPEVSRVARAPGSWRSVVALRSALPSSLRMDLGRGVRPRPSPSTSARPYAPFRGWRAGCGRHPIAPTVSLGGQTLHRIRRRPRSRFCALRAARATRQHWRRRGRLSRTWHRAQQRASRMPVIVSLDVDRGYRDRPVRCHGLPRAPDKGLRPELSRDCGGHASGRHALR